MSTKFHRMDRALLRYSLLNNVEGFDLGTMGHNSPEHLHYAIEAMKLGFADLYKYVTDPTFVDVPVDGLLSDAYTRSQRARISPERANMAPNPGLPQWAVILYISVQLTRNETLSPLLIVSLLASVRTWLPVIQVLCCKIEVQVSLLTRTMPTVLPRIKGRCTQLFRE